MGVRPLGRREAIEGPGSVFPSLRHDSMTSLLCVPASGPSAHPVPCYHLLDGESRTQPGHSTLPGEEMTAAFLSPTAAWAQGDSKSDRAARARVRFMLHRPELGPHLSLFVAFLYLLYPAKWLRVSPGQRAAVELS